MGVHVINNENSLQAFSPKDFNVVMNAVLMILFHFSVSKYFVDNMNFYLYIA